MQVLLDADILRYECAAAAESGWQSEGLPPFDYAANLLDERINNICAIVGATAPPILFLTGKGNFRYDIAKKQPYKTRPSVKPFHFHNLTAYMRSKYNAITSEGMEADDLMAIEQSRRINARTLGDTAEIESIICSRDKDLRGVPGYFYSWELGAQPSFGPELIDETGYIKLSADGKKLSGVGGMFFFSQCLMGDPTDSIPGIPKIGPAKAFKILQATTTLPEAFAAVLGAYRASYGDAEGVAEAELLEQGRLLWMTRGLHPDGSVVLWELPIGDA
jgi:hypothetical protein